MSDTAKEHFETLGLEHVGEVLKVTIDRPGSDINAVDETMHAELARLFSALRTETVARAVLLTGKGKAFSAGGDMNWFPKIAEPEHAETVRRDAKRIIWDQLDEEVPVVAAVNGYAVGRGASIALLSDIIFMGQSATVADPHVKVGIAAGDGGTAIWPMAVGPARAKQYLLTGDPLSAEEAERIGLVNFVVPDAELVDRAMAFAGRLAAGAPLAVKYTKMAVNKLVKDALNIAFDTSTALEMVTFKSDDHREALAAAADKRAPEFKGR